MGCLKILRNSLLFFSDIKDKVDEDSLGFFGILLDSPAFSETIQDSLGCLKILRDSLLFFKDFKDKVDEDSLGFFGILWDQFGPS